MCCFWLLDEILLTFHFSFLHFIFIFDFREREGREKERARNTEVREKHWLGVLHTCPRGPNLQSRPVPLTRNLTWSQTSNLLVCEMLPNQWSTLARATFHFSKATHAHKIINTKTYMKRYTHMYFLLSSCYHFIYWLRHSKSPLEKMYCFYGGSFSVISVSCCLLAVMS